MNDALDPDVTRPEQTESASDVVPLARSTNWGDLRLLSELGHGGFGRVYRAWDESLAREVALKIIKPRDAAQRASVLLEGQMLARVRHRNVVSVFRAQQIDDEVGLTMELIKGQHLADVVRHGGPMGAEEATVIGLAVGQALAAVHGAGLLHRDVKAHNVMRESGGRIVLMDFGAGRQVSESRISDLLGTPLYLAPEVFLGQPASPASDLYSLGVLLFYLVTRQHPVEGRTLTEIMLIHREGRARLLSDLRPDLPSRFVQVVQRALSPAPEQRTPTAGALIAELIEAMPGAVRHRPDTAANNVPGEHELAVPPPSIRPQLASVVKTWNQLPVAVRGAFVLTVAVAGVLALGLLTTVQYDRALQRSREFSGEGVTAWLEFGFRSLLGPIVYTTALFVIVQLVGALWHFLRRLAPPVRRLSDHARTSISGTFGRIAGNDGASLAQGLLVAQALTLVAVLWTYRRLIAVLPKTVNDLDAAALALLSPAIDNHTLFSYAVVIPLLIAIAGFSWYSLLRRPHLRATVPAASIAAAAGLTAVMILLIALPDRLFYKSTAPEVLYKGLRCFITGADGADRLLYCPEGTPTHEGTTTRTPIVKSADLTGEGSLIEPRKIFEPRHTPAPDKRP